ncbi:MAG: ribosome silencing factor [Tissierellia bacterium]|nr:ribosome silencing factor [Tissierellia bacterium]
MKDIEEKISVIIKACTDKKGFDVKILDISELSNVADYFIIVSGNTPNQVMAIADEIEDKMYLTNYDLLGKEGYREGNWILLDYGDIVVHVFRKEEREFYGLEKVWADGRELTLEDMI